WCSTRCTAPKEPAHFSESPRPRRSRRCTRTGTCSPAGPTATSSPRWTAPGKPTRARAPTKSPSPSPSPTSSQTERHPHPDPLDRRGRGSHFITLAPGGGEGRVRGSLQLVAPDLLGVLPAPQEGQVPVGLE